MGRKLTKGFVVWGQGLIELGMAFPLLLILYEYLVPNTPLWLWAGSLSLCFVAGYGVRRWGKLNKRLHYMAASVVMTALIAIAANGWGLGGWVSWGVSLLPFYRGVRAYGIPWDVYFPIRFYWMGLGVYFVASVAFRFMNAFEPYVPLVTWLGLAALVVTVFLANAAHLKAATLSKNRDPIPPSSVQWLNRLLIVGLLAVIALVALYDRLREAAGSLKAWVTGILSALIDFISQGSDEPIEEYTPEQMQPPDLSGLGEQAESARWLEILQQVAFYGMLVLIGAILLVLLYFLAKVLFRLGKKLYHWLLKSVGTSETVAEQGYEDEETNLFNWKEMREQYTDRMRDWFSALMEREPKWKDLTDNRERIRYLYRHTLLRFMQGGYEFRSHLTPDETGQDLMSWNDDKKNGRQKDHLPELVALYDRARYSTKEIADDEVNRVRE